MTLNKNKVSLLRKLGIIIIVYNKVRMIAVRAVVDGVSVSTVDTSSSYRNVEFDTKKREFFQC